MKACPRCKTQIDAKASKCPNCHSDLRNWFIRHPFWTILFILIILGIGVSSLNTESSPTATTSNSNTSGAVTNSEPKVIPEPDPIELSGSGQKATQKFNLENGLSVFKMTHSGTSNFAIWLLDSIGEKLELLVNELGVFNGSKAVGITAKGEYLLDLSTSGSWTIRIEQPRPTSAVSKPQTFSGKSQQASSFISLSKGLTTFKMKHSGSSNFAIWLLDKKGDKQELLVNELGAFDGSKAVGVSTAGIYLLDISADGDWTVTIE